MITIENFENCHILDVLKIVGTELGEGFYSKKQFETILNDQHNSICKIACYNNRIVGFSVAIIFENEQLFKITGINKLQLPIEYQNYNLRLGFLKTIAISEFFQKKGIGLLLCIDCIDEFEKRDVTAILGTAWKKGQSIHSEKILTRVGLQIIGEITEFWKHESLLKKYNCSICGEPPCYCTAVIFGKLH
jgi:ribosomal protein S18 acetylase RimI-like enzyme